MGVKPIDQIMMNMKLNYWYHLNRSTEDSWLRAAFAQNFKNAQGPCTPRGWTSSFAKEIQDIQKDIETLDHRTTTSRNIFKSIVKNKTKSHFDKLSTAKNALHRLHSLRVFPHFKNQGKPQEYLFHTSKQNIITSFHLGDAGLGNQSRNPIKQCPVCKVGNNTEAHLVFQCTAVRHLRDEWKFTIVTQTDDPDPMLQEFLDVNGLTPAEVAHRADLLEKLTEYHNLHLDELNLYQHNEWSLLTLSEKCDLCNFS